VNKTFIKYLKTKQAVTRFYNTKTDNFKLNREIIKQKPNLKTIKFVDGLQKANVPVICFVNDDLLNIPSFLKYYRNLGVEQFAFIDYSNTNDTIQYLTEQKDVSVFKSSEPWHSKKHKTKIINYFLLKYLKAKARPLILNSTEYIIYPYMENRNINELFYILNDFEQVSAFCVRLDFYAQRTPEIDMLSSAIDPFKYFPYFDRYNLTQKLLPWDVCKIVGGASLRVDYKQSPGDAPWLNSVQMMLNDKKTIYTDYTQATPSWVHNCSIKHDHRFVTIALANFLQFKTNNINKTYFNKHWSIKYNSPEQLEEMNILQRGEWF